MDISAPSLPFGFLVLWFSWSKMELDLFGKSCSTLYGFSGRPSCNMITQCICILGFQSHVWDVTSHGPSLHPFVSILGIHSQNHFPDQWWNSGLLVWYLEQKSENAPELLSTRDHVWKLGNIWGSMAVGLGDRYFTLTVSSLQLKDVITYYCQLYNISPKYYNLT